MSSKVCSGTTKIQILLSVVSIIVLLITIDTALDKTKKRTQNQVQPILTSVLPSFADRFPENQLIYDMMQLSADIFKINETVSPKESISNPKYHFEHWLQANFSTTSMIVTFQNDLQEDDDGDERASFSYGNDNGKVPVVIFRGTDNIQDWLVDVNAVLEPSKFSNAPEDVEIHKGFQDALFEQNVVQDIEQRVLDICGEDGQVYVTGHSLGGANSHIAATYLADRNPNMKVKMINFGSPRLGNQAFKSWTENELQNLSVWRVVNKADIVPRVVPRTIGFRHAGHLLMMYKSKSIVYYRQVGDSIHFRGAPWNWYYASSFREHPHPMYLKYIQEKIYLDQYWSSTFAKWPWSWNSIDGI